jgi:crotonobetainyl-CoA:carnitine CoA-transferase CaiB-like acyl-CoA transferase
MVGDLPFTGPPWRVDGGGWALRRTAPTLGQDTDVVLSGLLGMSEPRIKELRALGVVT